MLWLILYKSLLLNIRVHGLIFVNLHISHKNPQNMFDKLHISQSHKGITVQIILIILKESAIRFLKHFFNLHFKKSCIIKYYLVLRFNLIY